MSAHKHKCPQCNATVACNNPDGCPGEFAMALCGACPFIPWASLIKAIHMPAHYPKLVRHKPVCAHVECPVGRCRRVK